MTPPPPSPAADSPPKRQARGSRGKPKAKFKKASIFNADPLYPDSDGKPMADNTLQFRYIVLLKLGFDNLFKDREDIFVAGDLLWYPVQGHPKIRVAPDVLIAFGRPKGERGSYKQWEEGGIAPEFVIEVLSPGNRPAEMGAKAAMYLRYGVKEYVIYDPDHGALDVLVRDEAGDWRAVEDANGWRSELTGVTFQLDGLALIAIRPDGKRFESYGELADRAEASEQRAAEEARQKEEALARAAALEAKLRAAGIEP